MVGSQFSSPPTRTREQMELQQVERIRLRLEEELTQATKREKETKDRSARLQGREADHAALEGLDDSALSNNETILKASILSMHAYMDSKLDAIQDTLDQILNAMHKPGIRPAALPSLPLSAMTGLYAAQSTPPPSVSSTVALSQTVASSGPATVATPQSPPVSQAGQQYPWYPKTPLNPPATFSGDKKDEALDTWLRTVPVWVRAKRTLVEEEVITVASYLEGSAARWLNGLVASKGFARNMHDWAQAHTLESFTDLVEARWHNPQQAQIATDGLLKLDTRKYKSMRELTTAVERLIVVPGVEYNPQVLLTMLLRCLPTDIRNLLASEARREYHTFESFSKKAIDLEATLGVVDREIVHAIEIIPGTKTPKGRIYRMAPAELDELRRQLKELTEKGWIRPSTSPFGSPVLFVPKKGGTLRMCIDYKGLNDITVKNEEPLPRIDDLLDRVQGCKYYTKIDLKSGYHRIAIRPEDQHKTAFQTRYGLYEFVVMPFGLCNAPGTFQHAMNRIFHDYLDKFVVVYLDDILIFSRSVEEHAQHVDTVLSHLRQHNYKINSEKCEFGRTRILYLGHEVSADGIRPKDAKVASIPNWPRPQSVTEARSFLGMCGYYRNFVKNYNTITSPLTDLTRLDTPWDWTDECEAAFKCLKHALTHHEVLMVPDPQRSFVVTTDASQYGIGAVLAQQEGKKLRQIEYMSKKMSSKKLAKSTYEMELYALYKALVHWRHYLLGRSVSGTSRGLKLRLGYLPIPAGPGQKISMDFMDTLVTSKNGKNGKRHIFVIVDRFTKYTRLIAMPETARIEHVIKLFMDNWVRDLGLPTTIVSDRDVRFTSEMWKNAAEQMGSQLQMTSGNHPEANGQAEQMNRVVQHLLRHYIKPSQDDWDEKLPLIASLYNNVVHSTIGQTIEHIKKSQEVMIASENKRRRQSIFQVGERVWVKASELGQEFGISRKLMPQYFGPWEVLDIVGNDLDGPSYVIRIPGHLRTYPVFHASKLAPFAEIAQFPSRRSMLPPTMDGHVDVDDILDHRDTPVPKPPGRGRPPKPVREYRVHFRHHTDPKEDRWISRKELVKTAPQIVADYVKRLKGKAPA
ncbi:hypothetical protein CBR_g63062 [Chara braunii]|uniref:Integrase catalytic domain-containing protein n=1 Tax=Chara braunii TaxID=69332 RepID=A0A388K8Y5_CHABU|nr:hypothetical protein CBR_g63062 [Chara braunii]|eukprot:GBG66479.1 hypothetical protein CBR_g63062 [Chara braunii]